MTKILHKAMTVALASASITGLAMSGTAQAATYPAVQMMICNDARSDMQYSIDGLNQNGVATKYDEGDIISSGDCHNSGWWWKTDQTESEFKISFSVSPYTAWHSVTKRPDGKTRLMNGDLGNGNIYQKYLNENSGDR
ncbi:hypothetical protein AB0I77_50380 [Streptomyces sp. NPDC050619]|uniref:hypothetical protein n=1 Tax=Streptomyces sp. NPDC050619 TaxID=3157214 RepID=UPI0034372B8B